MKIQPDIWVIGDVQGCRASLNELLNHPMLASDPDAELWFAGDIVNRGPDSLGSLRRVMSLGDRATSVLGNHDLHLLAVAAGVKQPNPSDTIDDILNAPDSERLVKWMRHRPLAHYAHGHLLVHAGVFAQWSVQKTLELAAEVEAALRGPHWRDHLKYMYGDKPATWKDDFCGNKRLRAIINALTRMRLCDRKGRMEFSHKGTPQKDGELIPWFDVPRRATRDTPIIFGHWSALGLLIRDDAICLDTGCIWGRKLTALRLRDRATVQVSCPECRKAKSH